MNIQGTLPVSTVTDIQITNLTGAEKRCAMCKQRWDDGVEVVVLITACIQQDIINVAPENTYLVHTGQCLEDLIGTLAEVDTKPVIAPLAKSAELVLPGAPSGTAGEGQATPVPS